MKAISFLGFTKYEETTYLHPIKQGVFFKTPFFQEALVEFYQPEILYVLLTKTVETQIPKGATETNWDALKEKLDGKEVNGKKLNLQPIKNIPERNSPEDVWWIFQEITNNLQDGDRVIFDITYSFRSLPVVVLLAVTYLRVVRNVNIEGLIYGAYEAKNKETNETPTFDLLPIVSLLNWTTATDQFLQTGNGEALASLLHNSKPETENLASSIKGIAQGLQLLRPMDVMRESALLPEHIAEATPVISQFVPPFATLLKRVEKDYGDFGLNNPEEYITNSKVVLLKQLSMIEWYTAKGQTVQALSLAREWLPSLLCHHFQLDPLEKANRDEMELLLNGGKIKDSNGNTIKESSYLAQWSSLVKKKRKQINNLWGGEFNLANLRNDALHAGFRKKPKSAEEIIKQTEIIIKELKAIAVVWELTNANDNGN
ncbi:CRISPR-associated protein [[Phormidium ambiguum] IAM M-71]|uniref:CRISPR-associated protein n=1 Tax=[Phormidium ambiguum] IAM M-71 TaxID=454136 RepID=A0A1U7IFC3_9CYAN|nr:TIGR02221 family CRISPR-associated protein [Phormidium ambiguum]OKH35677.1 CRISPR-associated protein [Phormidium ambiguum IAM M-71]